MLSDGELKYYKSEKAAASAGPGDSLKSISLAQVHAAMPNPRHADMFIVDLGLERKIKLQAATAPERCAASPSPQRSAPRLPRGLTAGPARPAPPLQGRMGVDHRGSQDQSVGGAGAG